MNKTIAIIAPFIDSSQYTLDFCLRLKQNERELTLAAQKDATANFLNKLDLDNLRGMFDLATRRKLFQIRQQLTAHLMEYSLWEQIEPTIKKITILMELPVLEIRKELIGDIIVPGRF